jgi:hypothetical protein
MSHFGYGTNEQAALDAIESVVDAKKLDRIEAVAVVAQVLAYMAQRANDEGA